MLTSMEDLSAEEQLAARIFPKEFRPRLPYQWGEAIKILGITFDSQLTYKKHVTDLLSKAKIRHSTMRKLTHSGWGLDTNILRTAHSFLLTGLTRYGLGTVGSGLYEPDFCRLETRHSNIAVRRVLGAGTSARLESLYAVSDLMSVHNLYLHCCAQLLNRCLRARNSSIHERLTVWTSNVYGVGSWNSPPT